MTASPNIIELERLISAERLSSYVSASNGDKRAAIDLYDWNQAVSSAIFADLSRLEVTVRNVINTTMEQHVKDQRKSGPWYLDASFFSGKPALRSKQNIEDARKRATRNGKNETSGRVVAELMFGFWRFLCVREYLTSLWVPALARAFPNHPTGNARQVRADVERHMERLHFLRNRVAHHEPIHRRSLTADTQAIAELALWVSVDGCDWIASRSTVRQMINERPRPAR